MVDAIDHCHQLGWCHRDIKLENFLLDRKTMKPILIDFGMARVIPESGCYHDFPGSRLYSCPQILGGESYKVLKSLVMVFTLNRARPLIFMLWVFVCILLCITDFLSRTLTIKFCSQWSNTKKSRSHPSRTYLLK